MAEHMTRRTIYMTTLAVAVTIFVVAVARQFVQTPPESGAAFLDITDERLVAQGAELYVTHCAACHGADLEGEPNWRERRDDGTLPAPPHDETGHTWHHPDEVLYNITRYGMEPYAPEGYVSAMPAFDDVLTGEETKAVLTFIKSQWPEHIRNHQERINAQHLDSR